MLLKNALSWTRIYSRHYGVVASAYARHPLQSKIQPRNRVAVGAAKSRSQPSPRLQYDRQSSVVTRTPSTPEGTYISYVAEAYPKLNVNALVSRNEVGVQLLSPELHAQVFRGVSFPPPEAPNVRIAREHLAMHGLDPSQGSVVPSVSFSLPSLQGQTIDEHFHRIGASTAEPSLSLAKRFASLSSRDLPPKPEEWAYQSGWTKYHPDGSFESVKDLGEEQMLCFDVETMPPYHPFAIMACAVTPSSWYVWLSPWLLGESESPRHLIPFGDPLIPRVVVGHNVSYDRSRVREEYSLGRSGNRWIDTMALHVAVKGISSHQRPAWMSYRKSKKELAEMKEESLEVVMDLVEETEGKTQKETDYTKKAQLQRLKKDLEDSLPQLENVMDDADPDDSSKRWEDITSANSLADVARLHCGIEMDKAPRNDFMTATPDTIRANLSTYISYCADDVTATHAVFSKVLPAFLVACPSPVSWSGVMSMGSGFFSVNETWEEYLRSAEGKYRELEDAIRGKLVRLAESARLLMGSPEKYENDDWLKQLDWSPKVPGVSRGVVQPAKEIKPKRKVHVHPLGASRSTLPKWYFDFTASDPFSNSNCRSVIPHLLRLSWNSYPLSYLDAEGWVYNLEHPHTSVSPDPLSEPSSGHVMIGNKPVRQLLGPTIGGKHLKAGVLTSHHPELAQQVCSKDGRDAAYAELQLLADHVLDRGCDPLDPWVSQLDWSEVPIKSSDSILSPTPTAPANQITWPSWYWELASPKKGKPPGELDLTVRNRVSPILLRLKWLDWPLVHSREHGWTFRVSPIAKDFTTRQIPLLFTDPIDAQLAAEVAQGYTFYKLPHKDGEKYNVGSPLSKTFSKFAASGTLTSPGDDAKQALDMNAQCSYWISARDRVMNQMVVWDGEDGIDMGFPQPPDESAPPHKWGVILPQVITMGTVTRRAIEKTWLTASNAKPNRVGSELKAMVRAPPGYAIVGADVDSEELWISSVMGDAQFGLHGATAIGWMTLEGTKAAGTDLHSKTASILGITRDSAKVFNYSRIYGAGMKHAVQLLLQSNPNMLQEEAQRLAGNLYASTKGKNTHRKDLFGRKFWYGGTESYVFNKLEEIALSDRPQTPALGCGVTNALTKEYLPEGFGSDYMPSRINWVVQSSGVDYLHLLIVSMEYLLSKYDISARYLISVHDELRYLVKEEDRYRCALALQIANLWTRSLFAYKLGMDDLPQGVAFFSAVDIDHVLRKEVDMPCVTPSQPIPIPPGESLDITKLLEKMPNGSLRKDGQQEMKTVADLLPLSSYSPPACLSHRVAGAAFLRAQATNELEELKMLARSASGKRAPRKSSDAPSGSRLPSSHSSPSSGKSLSGIRSLSSNRTLSTKETPKPSTPKGLKSLPAEGHSHEDWLVDSFA